MGVEGLRVCDCDRTGNLSAALFYLHTENVSRSLHLKREDFKISLESFRRLLALGIPMGLTVLHHGDRYHHRTGSSEYLWGDLHGGLFCSRKATEPDRNSIYGVWRNDCHVRGSEPGSGKDGSCKTGSALYPDHDPHMECCPHGGYVFLAANI